MSHLLKLLALCSAHHAGDRESIDCIISGFLHYVTETLSCITYLQVAANEENADMSGYLKVWKNKKWKKMWFVVKDKALFTFKASEASRHKKHHPLSTLILRIQALRMFPQPAT